MVLEDDLRREGYQTEAVSDGRHCRPPRHFRTVRPDSPGYDAAGEGRIRVCREVRRAGIDTPIILLTALVQESEKVLGLELGADDYATKPYSARELRARVKAHLRGTAGSVPEMYRFGDAELDFVRCELRRGGRPVDLYGSM
jgi:DNA-binding response OmpR family regulator